MSRNACSHENNRFEEILSKWMNFHGFEDFGEFSPFLLLHAFLDIPWFPNLLQWLFASISRRLALKFNITEMDAQRLKRKENKITVLLIIITNNNDDDWRKSYSGSEGQHFVFLDKINL